MPKSLAETILEEILQDLIKEVKWKRPHYTQACPHTAYCQDCVYVEAHKYNCRDIDVHEDHFPPARQPLLCTSCGSLLYHSLTTDGLETCLNRLLQRPWPPHPVDAAVVHLAIHTGHYPTLEDQYQRVLNYIHKQTR